MSGTISGSFASGVTLSVNPTTIANTTTISSAAAGVVGVYGPIGTDWVLTNQGLVSETDASSYGVSFADAGTITNTASASITGGAGGIRLVAGGSVTNGGGIGGYRGVAGTGTATTVDNAGSIEGAGYSTDVHGVGVYLGAGGLVSNQSGGTISGYYGVDARNSAATVVNAGLIAGNYTAGNADGVYLRAGGSVTNQSGGTIKGDNDGVRISGAVGTVDNLGTISPSNLFSGGDGVYLANGGVVTNGASGGTVSGAYILGYRFGVEFGSSGAGTLINYGTISGNPGDPAVSMATGTIINGPSGATGARIMGGDQTSAVWISGAATVINYATIVGVENRGDPNIYFGISLGGAGSISNLGTQSLIEGYLGIYASNNDTVINAGTIASNYDGGADALVFGGGTNRLIIDPGARFIGAVSGGGAVTLAPSGNTTVIGTSNGVGTTTLELASGASAGTLSGLGTKYVDFSAVTIDADASWTFSGANSLIAGVTLTDSGTLADSGAFTNGGAITGAANGILLTTGATLTNQSGGSITGNTIGVSASGAATVVNAGSIGGDPTATGGAGVSLAAGGSVTNQSGGTITGAVGVYASSVAATVVNAGSIGGNATSGTGVFLQFGGTITNQTGGAISGGADAVTLAAGHTNRLVIDPGAVFTGTVDGGNTIGAASISTLELASGTGIGALSGLGAQYIDFAQVTIDAAAVWTLGGTATGFATLTNAGSLASGVTLGAGSFTVSNQSSGTITGADGVVAIGSANVVNAGSIAGTATASDGIFLEAGGSVTNQSSGTITGTPYGVRVANAEGTISNTGHIISVTSDGNSGIGVQFLAGSVTNASGGIITGGGFGVRITNGGYITNALGGTITGGDGVYSYSGPFTLVNAGSVSGVGTSSSNGGAYLWKGGSVTNASGGAITGYANGIIVYNDAGSVTNVGSIAGTHFDGVLFLEGGTVSNASGGTISGGNDGILIRGNTGTVINAGGIAGTAAAVIFAAGYINRLVVDPGATFTGAVDGGNTIGAAQVSTLELASGASAGTLSGLGTQFIDFAQSTIDVSANWILSGDNTLVAGATLTNSGTLTDVGTLTGNQIRLSGGALTIQTSGLLTSTYVYGVAAGGTDTVANYGTITTSAFSAVYLKAAGNVSNAAGALISSYRAAVKLKGTDATLSNLGQITSTSTGPGGYGIYLRNGGLVTNGQGGSGTSTASIQGYYGVTFKTVDVVNAYGTLVNFGTILGTGTESSGVQLDNGGMVFNGQSGATAALINGGRYGVYSFQGPVVNEATIIATGSAGGDYGVAIQATGSVSNLGTSALIEGYGGVQIGTDGTVTNAGTIESDQGASGVAVSFTDGNARLIDDPGAVFIGSIYGGSGGTAVLELASASGAGTLTGVGTSITNFTSLVFDAGAQWTVAGNDSATGLGTLGISGFISGDTIDLTGFDAASKTFDDSTDTLVLADDGGINHATLHMAGVFTTDDFFLSPDSHGGTFITTDAPCYRAGTRILTPSGEVPVEQLAIGDLIVTRSGEAKPIKWIGRRSYAARFIAGNHDVLPIRFAANALADGIPSRDLDVSPKHAMFIDEVLVPAEMLVNGISIRQLMDEDSVEYVHVELASHDIIIAEGADSETFVDCDSRTMFHNAADYTRRYPDDPGPVWQFCAPRIEPASHALVAIRARLAARAGLSEVIGAPEALQGNIELCDRTRMYGWVFDPTQPKQRARLEVHCDGELVGHVVADRHRHDLEKAGYLGDGRCSFDFTHPIHLSPLSDHVIELRRAADGAPIPGSPVRLPAMSGFDADGRAAVAQMLSDATQAATKASDLDELIVHQMTQVEALLTARARLDAGARADATSLHDRWGGLVPTAAVRRSASELRPQALFVDDMLPAIGVSGGANAAIDHMRALLRIGFDVSFVASQDLGDRHGRAVELAALGIRPLLAPWYGSVEEVLRRHTGRIDVVYLHRAGNAAAYGKLVRQYCPRALLVYGVADLHHLRLARQGAVEDRPEVSRYADRLRIEELMAARLADVVITHSNAEAALLRAQLPGVTVAQVPWSVPLRQSGIGFAEREGIVFVGNFGHAPNADAVHWLAQEIVPLVQQQDPAIRFRVIGNDMPESLRRGALPGLELVGPVERLDKVYDSARLTVAPLRYGAGIKAKVIESLAAGVPCVGTNIAFEGMALPTALSSCIADTPAAFAAALIGLYRDEAAYASTAEAGQRYALVNNSEVCVDGLMRQALAPALRQWAGITEELGGASVVQ
ncbi:MAG TPA: Hint domain-containing protein [Acetobacteraceae bacterium]|nr:Hint domain-containing protein [Acetobacteraceae bacterium]